MNAKQYQDYKATLKCSRCPEDHPACLDFHHPDTNKEFNVSSAVGNVSFIRLAQEIQKCDVLCSNCHRKLHYEERMAVKLMLESFEPLGDFEPE